MRAVVQRVKKAAVKVNGETVGAIKKGLVVFIGFGEGDSQEDLVYIAEKVTNLRIFEDQNRKMNCSINAQMHEVLCVSQFTLYGDCRKGRRPSFSTAAPPDQAQKLYQVFCKFLRQKGLRVAEGVFGALMQVEVFNDGPVTMLLDSKKQF